MFVNPLKIESSKSTLCVCFEFSNNCKSISSFFYITFINTYPVFCRLPSCIICNTRCYSSDLVEFIIYSKRSIDTGDLSSLYCFVNIRSSLHWYLSRLHVLYHQVRVLNSFNIKVCHWFVNLLRVLQCLIDRNLFSHDSFTYSISRRRTPKLCEVRSSSTSKILPLVTSEKVFMQLYTYCLASVLSN